MNFGWLLISLGHFVLRVQIARQGAGKFWVHGIRSLARDPADGRACGRNALHLASANGTLPKQTSLPKQNIAEYRFYANLLVFHVASALVKTQPPTSDTFGLNLFSPTLATLVFSPCRLYRSMFPRFERGPLVS